MILGKNTDTVYLSDRLKTEPFFNSNYETLTLILKKNNIPYKLLQSTKDIWCRDYMPIQKEVNKFIQFRYEPSYLNKSLDIQSNPKEVCNDNAIVAEFNNINLDGGNVIQWADRVIISERIFTENPERPDKNELITELEKILEAEIIIIPQINTDFTGHADGYLRFVSRNTVIGNHREIEHKYWKNALNKVLKNHNIEHIDCPFFIHKEKKHPHHAIGSYMNFLEVQDLIVVPIFEVANNKDAEVFDIFKSVFHDRKIETLNFNNVGMFGGLLNCSTWPIKTK